MKGAPAGLEKAQEIDTSVKPPPLFAKPKAEKTTILEELVKKSAELAETLPDVSPHVSARCGRGKPRAQAKWAARAAVARPLLPQIPQGRKTGRVATEKILPPGITAARAISQGKGKVKFGMKGRINRLAGGSLVGRRVAARADENQMPAAALPEYRQVVGAQATPKLGVYERGASLPAAAKGLKRAGVQKVGSPPRGPGAWRVGEKEQKEVKSDRGKTAGRLGRLKSRNYSFSPRQERRVETQDAAGQRASGSANLTTLMRDVVEQAKTAR